MTTQTERPSGIITELRIKNFKCFRDVVIPLRPLTIIYGQNSSGKSTIFQAIDMIRLACKMLVAKQSEALADETSMDPQKLLGKMPWYGSWNSLLHDKGITSIQIGISITSEPKKQGDRSPVQAVDFVFNDDWDVAAKKQGGKLPKAVRIRYWIDEEQCETPDIDINIVSEPSEKANFRHRQHAHAQFRTKWLRENVHGVSGEGDDVTIAFDLGECRFFKELNGPANKPAQKLMGYIPRTWEYLNAILRPDELFNPDHPDTVHIGAGEDYWVRERFRGRWSRDGVGRDRLSRVIPDLRRDVAAILTEQRHSEELNDDAYGRLSVSRETGAISAYGKELINALNNATKELDIPHQLEPEKGFADTRRNPPIRGISPFNVGHGIQYYIPRLLLSLHAGRGLSCIEEPEAHVHPRLQAELGAYFLKNVDEAKGQRLVESHSENMIIKIQHDINRTSRKDKARASALAELIHAVYVDRANELFVDEHKNGDPKLSESEVSVIRIDENGRFIDYWPDGFFPERSKMYF